MDDLEIHGLPRMDLKGLRLGLDTGFLRLMFVLDTFHRLLFVESRYILLVAHTGGHLFVNTTLKLIVHKHTGHFFNIYLIFWFSRQNVPLGIN